MCIQYYEWYVVSLDAVTVSFTVTRGCASGVSAMVSLLPLWCGEAARCEYM